MRLPECDEGFSDIIYGDPHDASLYALYVRSQFLIAALIRYHVAAVTIDAAGITI